MLPPLWSCNTQERVGFFFLLVSINDSWMAAGNEKEANGVVEDVSERYYAFNEVQGRERKGGNAGCFAYIFFQYKGNP